MRIRADGVSGTELGYTHMTGANSVPMVTQGVFTAGSTLTSKAFVITFLNSTAGNNVALHHIKLVGLRRQK
jgi:hypothetical protein